MKLIPFAPPDPGGEESVTGMEGPGAADHAHFIKQRGAQMDWSEADDAYVMTAVMHCTLPNCGYAETQEWDDDRHVERLPLRHVDDDPEGRVSEWEYPQ